MSETRDAIPGRMLSPFKRRLGPRKPTKTRDSLLSREADGGLGGARLSRAGLLLIRTLARAGSRAEQTGTPFHPDFHIPVVSIYPNSVKRVILPQ